MNENKDSLKKTNYFLYDDLNNSYLFKPIGQIVSNSDKRNSLFKRYDDLKLNNLRSFRSILNLHSFDTPSYQDNLNVKRNVFLSRLEELNWVNLNVNAINISTDGKSKLKWFPYTANVIKDQYSFRSDLLMINSTLSFHKHLGYFHFNTNSFMESHKCRVITNTYTLIWRQKYLNKGTDFNHHVNAILKDKVSKSDVVYKIKLLQKQFNYTFNTKTFPWKSKH